MRRDEPKRRVAAAVAYSEAALQSLLDAGSPEHDGIVWLLCGPFPPEVVTSDSWLVVRYPWPVPAGGGVTSRLKAPIRGLRLGRLLADAGVIVAADEAAAPDVRRTGRLYGKPTLGPPLDAGEARARLDRGTRR